MKLQLHTDTELVGCKRNSWCSADLERVLCVLDAIYPDVVVDGQRNSRREDGKAKYFDRSTRQRRRLAGQHVPGQRVGHHVALISVYLDVDGCVDCLVAECADRLQKQRENETVLSLT